MRKVREEKGYFQGRAEVMKEIPEVVLKVLTPIETDVHVFLVPETVKVQYCHFFVYPDLRRQLCFMCYPDKIVELRQVKE